MGLSSPCSSSRVPVSATQAFAQHFETRRVSGTWANNGGAAIDLPVVPARFVTRGGGGWWLELVGPCPFCGALGHRHGSNLDADWNASDNGNPLIYAGAPKFSHCRNSKLQGIYVNDIVAGLPAEVLGIEATR